MEVFIRHNAGDEVFESWLASIDPAVRERILGNGAMFFSIELPAFATFVPDRDRMRASGVPLTVVIGEENRDTWFGAAARGWPRDRAPPRRDARRTRRVPDTHPKEFVGLVRRIARPNERSQP